MTRLSRLLSIIAFSFALLCSATTAAEDHFKATDIFELEYVQDPRISPDGKQVVYVRRSMDIMTDRGRGSLWIVDIEGKNHRPVLADRNSYSSPRWSPDGKRLAYISAAEGSPQLYVRWMDRGQTALVTNLSDAPGAISWSPDGKWLAFTKQVKASQSPLVSAPAKPEGANWAPQVKMIDQLIYRADGAGFLEVGYSHVFIVSSEGGTARQITKGDFNHNGPLSWTPDSKKIAFSTNRQDDWQYQALESDIYLVSIDEGTLTRLTERVGPDNEAIISPNGKRIAFTGFDDKVQGYQVARLYMMNIDGSEPTVLTAHLDRSVQGPMWAGNNRLFFQYDDRGVTKLASSNLKGGVTDVAENLGGTTLGRPYTSGSFTVSESGTFALTTNTPGRPADLAIGKRAKVRVLTQLNADLLDHKEMAQIEEISWKSSFDNREIQGWIAKPPGFDPEQKYPFILEIHGGPFAAYGPNFSAEVQRYAAEGYVVLYANPRGSSSYGEEFGNLIHHAYPGNDYEDLMSGVDAVIEQGYIDKENLFVTGGSGGGVLTAWIVGKTDRFKAAVVAKPVINMGSFVLTSDFVNYFYKYWFNAYPWEDPEAYWKRSPLSLVGNVSTPTMLLTGEADHRTPISETEQYYVALKLRKIDTVMIRVPEAPHGIAGRPSNLIAKIDNILAWFKRYRSDNLSADTSE